MSEKYKNASTVNTGSVSNLASVPPVNDLDSFLSCQAVDINLIRISTAMSLLLRPSVLKLDLVQPLYKQTTIGKQTGFNAHPEHVNYSHFLYGLRIKRKHISLFVKRQLVNYITVLMLTL